MFIGDSDWEYMYLWNMNLRHNILLLRGALTVCEFLLGVSCGC